MVAAAAVTAVTATYVPQTYHCSAPRTPPHGRVRSESRYHGHGGYYLPGHVINYSCDDGYKLHGHSRSYCYYDSSRYRSDWRYPAPVCKGKSNRAASMPRPSIAPYF